MNDFTKSMIRICLAEAVSTESSDSFCINSQEVPELLQPLAKSKLLLNFY